mmetsp:Transcript_4808/g.10643  ORF Transcript_4808/g.10643 Transcript_4808/m.10643 type:complete len:212 (+) Transcript_4808:551-1186(+)
MVRYPHGGETSLHSLNSIIRTAHSLHSRRHIPLSQQPLGIPPVKLRTELTVDESRQRIRRHISIDACISVWLMRQKVIRPSRFPNCLHNLSHRVLWGDRKVITNITFAITIPSKVHSQCHGIESPLFGLCQNLLYQLTILPYVQLKHLRTIRQLANLGNTRSSQRTQPIQRSMMLRRLGSRSLSLPVKHTVTSRGTSEEWKLDILTKDFGG